MVATFGNLPLLDPYQLADACHEQGLPYDSFFGKANRFQFGVGPEPGTGTLLMSAADVDTLADTQADLVFEDGYGGRAPIKNLVITRVDTVTPGLRGDPAAARVVSVADRRVLLGMVPCNRGFNLYDCQGASLAGTAGYTWQSMVDALVDLFDDLDALTLPVSPDDTPRNFDFYGDWYAWDALALVLDRLGCAARWDPFADTFSVVQVGAADGAADGAITALDDSRLHDPDPLALKLGRVPQTARVLFKKLPPPTDGSSWWTVVEKPVPGGGPSGTVNLTDDMPDTPATAALLDARATARAADVGREWATGAERLNRVYSGIVADAAVLPGRRVKALAWGDVGGRDRGLTTEVYRGEGVLLPEAIARKFRPYDPNCGNGGCNATVNEFVSACVSEDNTTNTAPVASRVLSTMDKVVFADATAAALGYPLPDPAAATLGQQITVTKTDAGANTVTVENWMSEPFLGLQGSVWRSGVSGVVLAARGESVTVSRFTDSLGDPFWGVVQSVGDGGTYTPAAAVSLYDPYPDRPTLLNAWR